ncbi:hypothetical protein TSUD_71500 [Trifolium subterraneum]|nr:hypothetical protein TSUD_71500 [Trifolium subterraneum]
MDMTMWPFLPDLNSDVELMWNEPRCGNCALHDQVCGFSEDQNMVQVQCFANSSNQGLLKSAKYGIALGVGIPALLLIGLACFCGKRTPLQGQRNSSNVPTITISLEPLPSFVMGLDGATIEKYPKILLGESGRLLKPNDNTCSICLSEYQPKETLRSIPECNHYFHAACIDEWLKMNGSPFRLSLEIYNLNFTLLRCPSNVTTDSSSSSSSSSFQFPLTPIPCLSNDEKYSNLSSSSSSVIVLLWAPPFANTTLIETCEVISTAFVPLPWNWKDVNMWPFWRDINSDVELVWTNPRCGKCALNGQVCGFSEDFKNNLQVECFESPSNEEGLSRSAKYGMAIGVGIPALVCLIGFTCFCCGKMRTTSLDGQRTSSNVPTPTISLESLPSYVMGLDGATIEKYPKTLIGESGRLLKPNDNTCSICLSEYQPKETLRSIPECNHYFHAACIDEWLKMNGTCPICRNSPEAYSSSGPYFASLLLSPNSSSLSTSR